MKTIEHCGFSFTVTHITHTNTGTYYYLVMCSPGGYKAQATLVDEQGKLSLLDIRVLQSLGLNGMLNLCETLEKISHEVFPMIVKACQENAQPLTSNIAQL